MSCVEWLCGVTQCVVCCMRLCRVWSDTVWSDTVCHVLYETVSWVEWHCVWCCVQSLLQKTVLWVVLMQSSVSCPITTLGESLTRCSLALSVCLFSLITDTVCSVCGCMLSVFSVSCLPCITWTSELRLTQAGRPMVWHDCHLHHLAASIDSRAQCFDDVGQVTGRASSV